ncbi:STAS domain-containing protein [Arthrobacter sp. IA7]|uniref:DUF7793 family protein n=1 Tax=Arthrobacter ipis TaxID=2716202 RepID=UPI001686EBE1|nr:STAS/SEC14 domain-containing protein [Arthrobacter ipis]MBD1543576.1 STAS domain-containing protein [Arthrobacter ipis]
MNAGPDERDGVGLSVLAVDGATAEWVGDRILAVTLPSRQITAASASHLREQLAAVIGREPLAVLLNVTGVTMIDREAMTGHSHAATVTGLAVVGQSPVDKIVAHRLFGLVSPQCPRRYFMEFQGALDWLHDTAKDPSR